MRACNNLIPVKITQLTVDGYLAYWNVPPISRYLVINGAEPSHPRSGEVYGIVHRLSSYDCKRRRLSTERPWGYIRSGDNQIHAALAGFKTRAAAVDALIGTHLNPYAEPDRFKP